MTRLNHDSSGFTRRLAVQAVNRFSVLRSGHPYFMMFRLGNASGMIVIEGTHSLVVRLTISVDDGANEFRKADAAMHRGGGVCAAGIADGVSAG